MRITLLAAAALSAAALAASPPAAASQVPGAWFIGDWRCTLDGRPTGSSGTWSESSMARTMATTAPAYPAPSGGGGSGIGEPGPI